MMRHLAFVTICVIFATGVSHAQIVSGVQDSVLDVALRSMGLTQADLQIRGDTLDDVDRFDVTKRILEEPAKVNSFLPAFSRFQSAELLRDALFLSGASEIQAHPDLKVSGVPEPLQDLVGALTLCRASLDSVFLGFSDLERAQFSNLIQLVDAGVTVSETESDARIALGRRVNRVALLHSAVMLMDAIASFVGTSVDLPVGTWHTPVGRVVVGGMQDDVYDGSAVLVIDLGGHDRYRMPASHLSVVIDLGGQDRYEGAVGCGVAGFGVVVDLDGDDEYVGDGIGQGVGIGGVGVLADWAGNDVYRVGVGGQGFGLYGVGILCDIEGNDRYEGALLVQGVGAPGGIGILADGHGNDAYRAGGKYKDFRENGQFDQSMAQGFGYGVRPVVSGGIGLLLDGEGDDQYEVGYFGQGTGFWGSVGLLIDRAGNDQYVARRYAQGCGVHLAVGHLQDASGDDLYGLWGVGQGCGHDLGVGYLIDQAGADGYVATWLAQGVGNANGVGWLDDWAGDDVYEALGEDTQGFGQEARDYGSIGIFLDRAGKDQYRKQEGDGRVLFLGHYGVRLDWPLVGDLP